MNAQLIDLSVLWVAATVLWVMTLVMIPLYSRWPGNYERIRIANCIVSAGILMAVFMGRM